MADTQMEPQSNRLDLKQAVALATDFCRQLFPETHASNVLVEEVEESPDGHGWLITLGFDTVRVVRPPSAFLIPTLPREEMTRVYKTFMVDSESGRVTSMKIRQLA